MPLQLVRKYGGWIHCGVQSSMCSEKDLNGLVLMKLWKGKVAGMTTMCWSVFLAKTKGKSTTVHTPLIIQRYVIRNPDILNGNTSESEYGSDNENEAEEASSTNETAEIPVRTPVDSDDNTLPDLTVDEPPAPLYVHTPSVSLHVCTPSDKPPTPPHVCTPSKSISGRTPSSSIPPAHSDETITAAQILADLAEGGVEQLEAEPEPDPEPEAGEQVVFEDQTLEEIDIDILVSGVQRPTAIKCKPLILFCRKPTGARIGVHVGKQKGLKRNSGLNFTGLSKVCCHDFEVKSIVPQDFSTSEEYV